MLPPGATVGIGATDELVVQTELLVFKVSIIMHYLSLDIARDAYGSNRDRVIVFSGKDGETQQRPYT